ncbi:hypothetical protein M1D79_11225 [Enterobacter sp. SA24]
MPNLTFYIAENQADVLQRDDDFTHKCRALCCDILRAEPQNVHIIFIAVKPGCGQPVYAQLFYRLTTLRTQDVMENFMRETGRCHSTGLWSDAPYSLFWFPSRTDICTQLIPR